MPRFVLAHEATGDLRDIYDYIAADDPAAARRVLEDLRTAMHRLAEHPGLGHLRDDLADEALRVWTVHSYLVIYRPDARPLQIVRVLSGYRDIAALFECSEPWGAATTTLDRELIVRRASISKVHDQQEGRRLLAISRRPRKGGGPALEVVADHRVDQQDRAAGGGDPGFGRLSTTGWRIGAGGLAFWHGRRHLRWDTSRLDSGDIVVVGDPGRCWGQARVPSVDLVVQARERRSTG